MPHDSITTIGSDIIAHFMLKDIFRGDSLSSSHFLTHSVTHSQFSQTFCNFRLSRHPSCHCCSIHSYYAFLSDPFFAKSFLPILLNFILSSKLFWKSKYLQSNLYFFPFNSFQFNPCRSCPFQFNPFHYNPFQINVFQSQSLQSFHI